MRALRILLISLALLMVVGSFTTAFGDDGSDDKGSTQTTGTTTSGSDSSGKGSGTTNTNSGPGLNSGKGGETTTTATTPAETTTTIATAPATTPAPAEPVDDSARGTKVASGDHSDDIPKSAGDALDQRPGDANAVALPEPPQVDKTVGVKPLGSGAARIRLAGQRGWHELGEADTVPSGATVDATKAPVSVVVEVDAASGQRQIAVVFGAAVQVDQRAGTTHLNLRGGSFRSCSRRKAHAAAARDRIVRGLWATAKGRFRTHGRDATATVRGTRWATIDRCHSTSVRVFEGIVDVADLGLHKVFTVKGGEKHVARDRRR
jgi:hypothetical protein